MYGYEKPMKAKKSSCCLPEKGYEKKIDMPRSNCAPYSKDNAKEYSSELKAQEAYIKKNKANHS